MSSSDATPDVRHHSLFKYMRREHAARLLREGVLRIGTLHEYRNVERHGAHVGDAEEGSKGAKLTVPHLEANSAADLPEFVRGRIQIGLGTTLEMVNTTFIVSEDSSDLFIFSCSSSYDPNAMLEMGYEACVKISKPAEFFSAVSHTMRHRGNFEGLFPCVYRDRFTQPGQTHSAHPALLKDPRYAPQREQRAIWSLKASRAQPVIITCRKAARYCERVA